MMLRRMNDYDDDDDDDKDDAVSEDEVGDHDVVEEDRS